MKNDLFTDEEMKEMGKLGATEPDIKDYCFIKGIRLYHAHLGDHGDHDVFSENSQDVKFEESCSCETSSPDGFFYVKKKNGEPCDTGVFCTKCRKLVRWFKHNLAEEGKWLKARGDS